MNKNHLNDFEDYYALEKNMLNRIVQEQNDRQTAKAAFLPIPYILDLVVKLPDTRTA